MNKVLLDYAVFLTILNRDDISNDVPNLLQVIIFYI